jgi:stress response protein SCP2
MTAMISTNSPSTGQQHTASTLLEVVLGLHWDPPSRSASGHTPDLDALCVLCDAQGSALEIVHPNNPCGGQGSIVHTGDSQTGASSWDDERIFVFLDALPQAVSSLVFIVASAAGHSFDEVPGALCHLSDALSEAECFSQDLTALVGRRIHVVATLRRTSAGWSIIRDSDAADAELLGKVRRMLDELKRGDKSRTAGPR